MRFDGDDGQDGSEDFFHHQRIVGFNVGHHSQAKELVGLKQSRWIVRWFLKNNEGGPVYMFLCKEIILLQPLIRKSLGLIQI